MERIKEQTDNRQALILKFIASSPSKGFVNARTELFLFVAILRRSENCWNFGLKIY
jgi:hypothetical protein